MTKRLPIHSIDATGTRDGTTALHGDGTWKAPTTDPEVVRDTIAAALVAGAGMTITPDDAANTITLASSGGGGGSLTVQDENGNVGAGVTQIDFQGAGVTATAGTGEVVVTIAGGQTYSTYTPVLTGTTTNPALGSTGAATGRYFQDGKHVVADVSFAFGGTGVSAGSGTYYASLPVTSRTPTSFEGGIQGKGYLYDASSGAVRGVLCTRVSSTQVQILVADGSLFVTHAVPWAWATGDVLILHFDYEAA